jgi:acyl carrier protein
MTREEFIAGLTELLEADPPLTGSEALAGLANWDSLAAIGVMAMADDRCGIRLVPKRINSCQTVDDLVELVLGKRAAN